MISSKFSPPRVSEKCTLGNFQKNFPLPKNGGHFEFPNFCQKWLKHKFASISLTVRDKAISSKFSSHRESTNVLFAIFKKIFPSPKMAAILNFRIFLLYPRRKVHKDLQSTFLSRFLSYLAGGLVC